MVKFSQILGKKNKTSIIEETKGIKNIKSEQIVEDKKNDNEKNKFTKLFYNFKLIWQHSSYIIV